jgi:hypothetical protein
MDDRQIDLLAKQAANGTRRSLVKASLGAALGGVLALAGRKTTLAGRGRPLGSSCRSDADCASEYCGNWDAKHNRGTCLIFCEYTINGCYPV